MLSLLLLERLDLALDEGVELLQVGGDLGRNVEVHRCNLAFLIMVRGSISWLVLVALEARLEESREE